MIFRRIGRSGSLSTSAAARSRSWPSPTSVARVAPRPFPTASTPAPEQRKPAGRHRVPGTRWVSGTLCHGYPGHRTTRRPVPAEDWNELTSSAALKDRDSSRDLWSPHPPPLPATLFAVHRPGIPEASRGSHGMPGRGSMPCRGSAPGGAGARLALADSFKVSRRTDILREVERRFLAGLKAGSGRRNPDEP